MYSPRHALGYLFLKRCLSLSQTSCFFTSQSSVVSTSSTIEGVGGVFEKFPLYFQRETNRSLDNGNVIVYICPLLKNL